MKLMCLKISLLIALITSNVVFSQVLNLGDLVLKAHYPLSEDGVEITGNTLPIPLENPNFNYGGIRSIGCYSGFDNYGDSCLIQTPLIESINDDKFAIQIDFKINNAEVNLMPIIIGGSSYRFVGLEVHSDSVLVMLTNNVERNIIEGVNLRPNVWYNAVIIHNKTDSTTEVYLNHNLVHTKKVHLNYPNYDAKVLNSSFSSGKAFNGCWKGLKFYSKNYMTSTKEEKNEPTLKVYPNPSYGILFLEKRNESIASCVITDIGGRVVFEGSGVYNWIDVNSLVQGCYFLTIHNKVGVNETIRFVKK